MNFGITLSNRGVLVGLASARDLLALADAVEASPAMDSVWCGDALFVNRRLDALADQLQSIYLKPGSFVVKDKDTPIASPTALFAAVLEAGRSRVELH